MKFKKLMAMLLAVVMMMALVVPAFAVSIEDPDDRLHEFNEGVTFDIGDNEFIIIKRGNNFIVWADPEVYAADENVESIARGMDNSLDNEHHLMHFDGRVTETAKLYNDGAKHEDKHPTDITVADGKMTIKGDVSHIIFDNEIPEKLWPNVTFNLKKQIKDAEGNVTFPTETVTTTDETFSFNILDAERNVLMDANNEPIVLTTDTEGKASVTVKVAPGKDYYIHEINVAEKYDASEDVKVSIPTDAKATYTATVTFTNTLKDEEEVHLSSVFAISKVVESVKENVSTAGFKFEIYNEDGEKVGEMTSAADGTASATIQDLPAGTYTIEEVEQDSANYEVNTQVINAYVDEDGKVSYDEILDEEGNVTAFDDTFTNYELGELDVSATVKEKYNEETHDWAYKYYSYDTLVAGINPLTGNRSQGIKTDNGIQVADGVIGHYLGNGMTYLTIDKAALADGNEIELNISRSNKTGNAKKSGTDKWNSPIVDDKTFTLSMNEAGQLVVESGLTAEESTFGAKVYGMNETVNGCSDIKHDNQETYALPDGDAFKFFIHWENTSYTLGEVIGCRVASTTEKIKDFTGAVTMKVTDEDETVVYEGEIKNVKVARGTYTVAILADGVEIASKTVTVANAGETQTVAFGELYVQGETVVASCPYVPAYNDEHGIHHADNPFIPEE